MKHLASVLLLALAACGGGDDDPSGLDAASGQDASPTAADAPAGGKRVFITAATFTGNLGGPAGADASCAAAGAALGGTWIAWLSTTTDDAIDRVADVGPWYDVEGTRIFADRAALAGSPETGLWYDEAGVFLASDHIWTGTGFGGTYIAALIGEPPCGEWTSGSMADQAKVGQVGRADGAAWTAQSNTTCDQQAHLLCLEQ
jgi:hypothetical protein